MTIPEEPVIDINPVEPEPSISPEPLAEKHKKHGRNGAFWPILLILIGIILLFQNLGLGLTHFNWWALFIYIPVAGSLASAWSSFRKFGGINRSVLSSLGSALVVGTVATMLLVGADWSRWWPLVLIAAGTSGMLGGGGNMDTLKHKHLAAWSWFSMWVGAAVTLLGLGFLVNFLPIPSLTGYLDGWRWWAAPILFAGIGAFVVATIVCVRNAWKMDWTTWVFVFIGVTVAVVCIFALYNLSWGLLAPVILIGAGLVVLSRMLLKN